jgi:zinc protease
MLNRSVPPPIHAVSNLTLPAPELLRLDNGQMVYASHFPGCEVFRVEVVFWAGRPEERVRPAIRVAARLVRDGTMTRTGAEIAEQIDFYGGSISTPVNMDSANVVLHGLKKYAVHLMPVLADLLQNPVFPEKELDTIKENSIQSLRIDLEKGDVLAFRKVTELIYGEEHPYGYNSTEADYRNLTREDVVEHYQRLFTPHNCTIFVAGDVDTDLRGLLNQTFGQTPCQYQPVAPVQHTNIWGAPIGKPQKLIIKQPGAFQASVKMGRRLFNRQHPDFNGLFILNTIFGGYFGSRLMTNIREKKGFTYNIYATTEAMLHDGYLMIGTEVNPDKADATLRAIKKEMKMLREQPVSDAELDMVRNYLLGMLLTGLDGPLNIAEMVKTHITERIPLTALADLENIIQTITAEQLQQLAQKYLDPDDFWTVVVLGE